MDEQDKDVALIAAIDAYADTAIGATDDGELSRQRSLALDAYQGKNIEPAPEGQSQVIDWTVFETVQWILPSLLRIFAAGDDIVEFEPTGEEDEEVAQQETEVLNYLVTQKNNWFLICLQWFQDALISKNAYVMAYIEERQNTEVVRYEGQSEEQLTMLLDDDVDVVGHEQYIDEDQQGDLLDPTGNPVPPEAQEQVMQMYQQMGAEPQYAPVIKYNIEVRENKPTKRLRFMVLPPENCLVGEDTTNFTIDEDCNYFEYFEDVTLSDLRRDGYDVADDIATDDDTDSMEAIARDDMLGNSYTNDADHPDPSMRVVRARTIWIRADSDGDGIAELQQVVRVGDEILEQNTVSTIPVSSIVPFINTHRHVGTSVGDLVFDIQRIKTSLLRNGLDGMYLAVRPRHAISDKVNLDDMLISRAGSLVRLKNGAVPGEGHIMPLPTENTFPMAQQGLLHMDGVTESRVGVSRQFQGIDTSANNDFNRIGQLSTMAAQRVEQIARIFGNGVERLFAIAHELIIKSGHSMEAIKLRGQWVTIDPGQWQTGRDMRVVAPFAAGNKDSLLQRLMIIATYHEKALAAGLPIVDVNNAYNLAKEIASAADLSGDKFFTDPRTVEPKPPAPDHTMIALEIENKKADNEAKDEQQKAEIDKYKADLDAQVRQYQIEANTQLQVALANIKAGNSVDLEKVRAQLKVSPIDVDGEPVLVGDAFKATEDATRRMSDTMNAVIEAITELKNAAEAPREIVREGGQVTGVKINGEFRPIQRGPGGEITGA